MPHARYSLWIFFLFTSDPFLIFQHIWASSAGQAGGQRLLLRICTFVCVTRQISDYNCSKFAADSLWLNLPSWWADGSSAGTTNSCWGNKRPVPSSRMNPSFALLQKLFCCFLLLLHALNITPLEITAVVFRLTKLSQNRRVLNTLLYCLDYLHNTVQYWLRLN